MTGDRPVSILMVAGEESGDRHGAQLLRGLKNALGDIRVCGIGGAGMEAEGMELLHHYRRFSVVGITEVIRLLPRLRRVMDELERRIRDERPDLVILIDYPGFNLRLAKRAKRLGASVFYYIAPQVWAWGSGRLKTIAETVDRMAVILPFEPAVFRAAGLDAEFVGNPLLDTVKPRFGKEEFFSRHEIKPGNKVLGLLPGSRRQEVRSLLPVMLDAFTLMRASMPGLAAVVGAADSLGDEEFLPLSGVDNPPVLVRGETYDVMAHSDFVLAASGTATLETAVLGTPMILLYKTSFITYQLARILVKIPLIGLVNIIAGREIVPEFVQGALNPGRIAARALEIMEDPAKDSEFRKRLLEVKNSLGGPGAAERAARMAADLLRARRGEA